MFTGIITAIGNVLHISTGKSDAKKSHINETNIRIAMPWKAEDIIEGASIACSGICFTVTKTGRENNQNWFEIYASSQSFQCTTIGKWKPETQINLEPALRIGGELGGHIVTGHVDATTEVIEKQIIGDSTLFRFKIPPKLKHLIAPKGSIALDGISLTVNTASDKDFSVNIIPYTLKHTTWKSLQWGDMVNLEVDTIARYAARLTQYTNPDHHREK